MAMAELTINEDQKTEGYYFSQQRVRLELCDLRVGWNVVSMKYFTPYQQNRVGLHKFID